MKNILKNKATFFAQYWGQKIMTMTVNENDFLQTVGFTYMNKYKVENCHLELKPISLMSDEDALKIAELFLWNRISESAIIAQTKELFQKQFQTNLYRENWSDAIDKARELGYAHRWNDISVEKQIEYGWIRLKNNN